MLWLSQLSGLLFVSPYREDSVLSKPAFYNQKQKVVSADNETLNKPLVTFIYSSW